MNTDSKMPLDSAPKERSDLRLSAHLFVCTNQREKGESCGGSGSAALRDALKALSKDPSLGWKGRVRINNAGCLGHCAEGIAAVCYPSGTWMTGLKAGDTLALKSVVEKELS